MYYFGTEVDNFVVHPHKYHKWLRQLMFAPTIERLDEVIEKLQLRFAKKIQKHDLWGAAEYVRSFLI